MTRTLIMAVLSTFLLPLHVLAAEIYFGAPGESVQPGASVRIGVFLNTDAERVNAVEGDIVLASKEGVIRVIDDADSIISLWVERPAVTADGSIHFSGIVPGGYLGDGQLFSFLLEAPESGTIHISSENESVLLHDGMGTATTVRGAPLLLTIDAEGAPSSPDLPFDDVPPEPFVPVVGQDPNIFDGLAFVSFSTRDVLSGIDHFELQERYPWYHVRRFLTPSPWRIVSSPAVLKDQELESIVRVKAFDRAGNARLEEVSPKNPPEWYEHVLLPGILIPSVGALAFVLWRKYKKR